MEQTSDFKLYMGDIVPGSVSSSDVGAGNMNGTVSDSDYMETVSAETLQRYFEESHMQYQSITSGMLMIAIFLGLIVGILIIQAFWHGGNH